MNNKTETAKIRKKHNLDPPITREAFVKLMNELGRNNTAKKLGITKHTVYQWTRYYKLTRTKPQYQ